MYDVWITNPSVCTHVLHCVVYSARLDAVCFLLSCVYALSHTALPLVYDGVSPKTLYVHRGDLAELPCDFQPGRARSLYSVTWVRGLNILSNLPSPPYRSISADNYSLFLVADETERHLEGTKHQCTVDVKSCSGSCPPNGPVTQPGAEIIVRIIGKWVLTCSREHEVEYQDYIQMVAQLQGLAGSSVRQLF